MQHLASEVAGGSAAGAAQGAWAQSTAPPGEPAHRRGGTRAAAEPWEQQLPEEQMQEGENGHRAAGLSTSQLGHEPRHVTSGTALGHSGQGTSSPCTGSAELSRVLGMTAAPTCHDAARIPASARPTCVSPGIPTSCSFAGPKTPEASRGARAALNQDKSTSRASLHKHFPSASTTSS